MGGGLHPAAVAVTTPEARKGRTTIARIAARWPRLVHATASALLPRRASWVRSALIRGAYRLAYEAYNRRDWEVNTLIMDRADYRYVNGDPDVMRVPDAKKEYPGVAGYLEAMDMWLSAWSDMRLFLEEVIEAGPNCLVGLSRQVYRGAGSSVPLEGHHASVDEFRGGRLIPTRRSGGIDMLGSGRSAWWAQNRTT